MNAMDGSSSKLTTSNVHYGDRGLYQYDTLKAKEVLVTMDDVGPLHRDIVSKGVGLWCNYILSKERRRTLEAVQKKKLGRNKWKQSYHLKSLPASLDGHWDKLAEYCQHRGIHAIVPTSVRDEMFVSTHRKQLENVGIHALVCEDPRSYLTLDHKWLSYRFCVENGIAQSKTLPLRDDTAVACRWMVSEHVLRGTPCFIKECFDTCAGIGVTKVDTLEEYDVAVATINAVLGGLQPASTADEQQHLIVQVGHPGKVHCAQAVYFKGVLVSCYITKENEEIISQLDAMRNDMLLGRLSPNKSDMTCSLKLDLSDPIERHRRDLIVEILQTVGREANYTGMCEVEFMVDDGDNSIPHVMEFNPRFSGACHSLVGSGMIQDYMGLLAALVNHGTCGDGGEDAGDLLQGTNGETSGDLPHIRSDAHVPQSNFREYNCVGFYLQQPALVATIRSLRTMRVASKILGVF